MCESHVTGCQFAVCVVVNAQTIPGSVIPRVTTGFAVR